MWNETSAKYLLSTGKVDLFCKQELKFTLITVRSVKTWSNETWVSFQNFFFVKFSCQNIEEGLTLNNTMFNNLPILLKDQTYSQNFVTQSIALFKYHWYIAEDNSFLAYFYSPSDGLQRNMWKKVSICVQRLSFAHKENLSKDKTRNFLVSVSQGLS